MQALALTLNRARLMRDSHHPDTADDIRHTLVANVSYILGAGPNPSLSNNKTRLLSDIAAQTKATYT
jgi:hypothetical protein